MSQPKRLALLAYLAVLAPEPETRERLLPMFWPHSDAAHARLSLRQAIHFIRATIVSAGEPDILVSVSGDKLGLDRTRVWSDVAEFDAKMTAGDYVSALALYRGDFLQGLSVPGAPEFQHWAGRERFRLRRAAETACLRTAEKEVESGNLRGALYWAQRGEVIAPTNESFIGLQTRLAGAV